MENITQGALHLAMQICGNREDARDILHNAVVKSLEHRNAPRPNEAGYRAWFYRVVHNQAIDCLRRRRHQAGDEDPETVPAQTPDQDALLDQQRRKLLLHRALGSLKCEQREIICLKDFHDFSYDDIASIMNLERGTVMSRLHRARSALRDKLVALDINAGGQDE